MPSNACSVARRSIRLSGVFAVLMALALGLVASGVPAGAQGLSVTGFSPIAAAPGEGVTLMGSGFASDPADHFAFVLGPPGQGALLEPVSTLPGTLQTVLGPSAATFEGPIFLWRGRRHSLPRILIGGERGAWQVHFAGYFVPTEAAISAKPFRVDDTTPHTGVGTPGISDITLEVEPNLGRHPDMIDLVVMIDGGGCGANSKPGGTPLQESSALPCRAFQLQLENIDPVAVSNPGATARDLALVLQSTFGPVGLVAIANGPWVHISWSRLSIVENAFGVLRFGH